MPCGPQLDACVMPGKLAHRDILSGGAHHALLHECEAEPGRDQPERGQWLGGFEADVGVKPAAVQVATNVSRQAGSWAFSTAIHG